MMQIYCIKPLLEKDLRTLPLLSLIELASEGNTLAIEEIVQNRLYRESPGAKPRTFPELVKTLVQRERRRAPTFPDEVWELAVDLTVEKFVARSPREGSASKPGTISGHRYRAFLDGVGKQGLMIPKEHLEQEPWVSEAFTRFLKTNIRHSCMEAKRRYADRFSSRYVWRIDGVGAVTVRLPRSLAASQRRKWLVTHIPDVDLRRLSERERIQGIIDRELCFGGQVSLDLVEYQAALTSNPPDWAAIELDRLRFPQFVAEEKANSIDLQRPAIRALGRGNLRRLVLEVFANLLSEEWPEERLAESFGLTKTALSHFSGSKWHRGSDGTTAVPDLWANVAHLLASHPQFMDAAEDLGFLKEARETLKRVEKVRMRERSS